MKYTVKKLQKYHLAYGLLPYKRNQDVIKIHEFRGGDYCAAVVDGWNRPDTIVGDDLGQQAAQLVAERYPEIYSSLAIPDPVARAKRAAEEMDRELINKHPQYVSCVGTFLFCDKKQDVLVFVGKGVVLSWNGITWEKPKEIGDHSLDETKFGFPNEVSRFFGRGELKGDPLYSAEPDVVMYSNQTPLFFATDGIEDILTIADLNALSVDPTKHNAKEIVETILNEVSRRGTQRDDISILVRTSKEVSKPHELREDRVDELDAAKLSREDRGKGIPMIDNYNAAAL